MHEELLISYQKTIEGWSNALDLRDKETEGHTLRVTQTSVEFGKAMHVNDDDLEHIRLGSLLHDVGKLGVPDAILLKPGKLTDEEWDVMRKHPVYAYEWLSPIPFLEKALDIPYCHHEKWDGSGYPRGLHGENIPLFARLFAIVDVWDALCSERPYRAAIPEPEVLSYIQKEAGTHFDPQLVDVFVKLKSK
jgi:HD-GYP domain-containing protein (c-di-GMP phosphodiesterase class II)